MIGYVHTWNDKDKLTIITRTVSNKQGTGMVFENGIGKRTTRFSQDQLPCVLSAQNLDGTLVCTLFGTNIVLFDFEVPHCPKHQIGQNSGHCIDVEISPSGLICLTEHILPRRVR